MQRYDAQCGTAGVFVPIRATGNFVQVIQAGGVLTFKDDNGNIWNAIQNWGGKVKFFGSIQVASSLLNDAIVINVGDSSKSKDKKEIEEWAITGMQPGVVVVPTPLPVTIVDQPIEVEGPYTAITEVVAQVDLKPLVMGAAVDMSGGNFTIAQLRMLFGDGNVRLIVGEAIDYIGFSINNNTPQDFDLVIQDFFFPSYPVLLIDIFSSEAPAQPWDPSQSITFTTAAGPGAFGPAQIVDAFTGEIIPNGIITAFGSYYVQFAGMAHLHFVPAGIVAGKTMGMHVSKIGSPVPWEFEPYQPPFEAIVAATFNSNAVQAFGPFKKPHDAIGFSWYLTGVWDPANAAAWTMIMRAVDPRNGNVNRQAALTLMTGPLTTPANECFAGAVAGPNGAQFAGGVTYQPAYVPDQFIIEMYDPNAVPGQVDSGVVLDIAWMYH